MSKANAGRIAWPLHAAASLPFKRPAKLLSVNADSKTVKGTAAGYLTAILYLAPGNVAGVGNACAHASGGCAASCLFRAGQAAVFKSINSARVMKSRFLAADRAGFLDQLRKEIAAHVRKAEREGMRPAVRLNGTSDLPWETLAGGIMADFPAVQFYDYTKNVRRCLAWAAGRMPANYHLTFSLSESNAGQAALAIAAGVNVAAVADGLNPGDLYALPAMTAPAETFDADATDLRFLDGPAADGRGRFGLLRAKGPARKDQTGFVIRIPSNA